MDRWCCAVRILFVYVSCLPKPPEKCQVHFQELSGVENSSTCHDLKQPSTKDHQVNYWCGSSLPLSVIESCQYLSQLLKTLSSLIDSFESVKMECDEEDDDKY
ncbi:hypothetical protein TNIN_69981 [Trichonephila inaurata madagascariensis]|uniref:Uncharacterized protein n=1 Tax=Trichonephila inaurata madagascariensis TaxID=2747483 RepID=A0A8X6Y261_9ARAC|nr:hypothetical protein TNIN_69981 [Trichonephila inaurata madagascariensis]